MKRISDLLNDSEDNNIGSNFDGLIFKPKHSLQNIVSPNSVLIYRRTHDDFYELVREDEAINKDIIHYFLVRESSIRSTLTDQEWSSICGRLNSVYIDDSCFKMGNTKIAPPLRPESLILRGRVTYRDKETPLCSSCSDKKATSSNLQARKCYLTPYGFLITASLRCNGLHPYVKCTFELQSGGRMVWTGSTYNVAMVHNRRKIRSNESSKVLKLVDMGNPLLQHRALSNRAISIPFEEHLWPEISQLNSRICEVLSDGPSIDSDSSIHHIVRTVNNFISIIRDMPIYSDRPFNFAWNSPFSDVYRSKFSLLSSDKVLLIKMMEYMSNIWALSRYVTQEWCEGPSQTREYDKQVALAKIAVTHNDICIRDPAQQAMWKDILAVLHADFIWNVERKLEAMYCMCASCASVHLSFIIRYAVQKGATYSQLDECTQHYNVLGKISVTFTELLMRKGHLNMAFYFSNCPVGFFSRSWLPPQFYKDQIVSATERYCATLPAEADREKTRKETLEYLSKKEKSNHDWDSDFKDSHPQKSNE